eukprot:NODE_3299_length_1004_cov_29.587435_g3033_i0.p1 GENE.NODE_3299_length_1004_cov_29.587435_g3033_i0~~NODE_3299_length_1004_cov_29.587435_g3033_i0.p1  ORF type:complete len:204 (+),score=24.95 NODE_3299_length_1004_cov_29.587435_g3033_i0:202-813(+)
MPPKSKSGKRDKAAAAEVPVGNPKVFFEISLEGAPIGRMEFELHADLCPRTSDNFRVLCTGPTNEKGAKGKPLTTAVYRGSRIHRVTDFMIQGGDLSSKQDGKGQESIYGSAFEDENFDIPFEKPGVLAMANSGPNTNGSQYIITTKPAPWLKGRCVAFGTMLSGDSVLQHLASLLPGCDSAGHPAQKITIVDSGLVVCEPAG